MKATQRFARSGPKHLARQHHPRSSRQRHAETLHRRIVGNGADVESHDLRPRDQEQRDYDDADPPEAAQQGKRARSCSSTWRWRTSLARPTYFGRSSSEPTASTAGYRWRCRRCWPTTRPARSAAAKDLHARAAQPNLFIKIPGTKEGLPAIEEAIFAGIPVNVTLLFSREQYLAAAEAFLRGIERRIAAGLNPEVGSVASVFVSRWDVAVAGKVPEHLHNRLGIAIGQAHLQGVPRPLDSPAGSARSTAGPRPQRLLWASTGTKDPKASDILYVKALAAPFTVNTMPEGTLKASPITARSAQRCRPTAATARKCCAEFAKAGIDIDALAATASG